MASQVSARITTNRGDLTPAPTRINCTKKILGAVMGIFVVMHGWMIRSHFSPSTSIAIPDPSPKAPTPIQNGGYGYVQGMNYQPLSFLFDRLYTKERVATLSPDEMNALLSRVEGLSRLRQLDPYIFQLDQKYLASTTDDFYKQMNDFLRRLTPEQIEGLDYTSLEYPYLSQEAALHIFSNRDPELLRKQLFKVPTQHRLTVLKLLESKL